MKPTFPIIDFASLARGQGDPQPLAIAISEACRDAGFFYVTGHGVSPSLQIELTLMARTFFELPAERKLEIGMELGGKAWRGYFPVGGELTSGLPDLKEGIYFGAELDSDHPLVRAGKPLPGPNLFPDLPGFSEVVLEYMDEMTRLGHIILQAVSLSLGLDPTYFFDRYTAVPITLFRMFNYPPASPSAQPGWGVGEHTDYGLITILKQGDEEGLEVKTPRGWVSAPPIPGTFVCNIGDMLDRMTGGLYRSTPHRVRASQNRPRLSFPFFFDPNFDAVVKPIPDLKRLDDDRETRWDGESVHDFWGTYGEYLWKKVSRVFPQLAKTNSPEESTPQSF